MSLNYLFAMGPEGMLRAVDVDAKRIIVETPLQYPYRSSSVNDAAISAGAKYFAASHGASISAFSLQQEKFIGQFFPFTDGEWVILTPECGYNCSENGMRHLRITETYGATISE